MSLNAGEVFVIVGARIDAPAIARGHAALDSLKAKSDEAQASIERSFASTNRSLTQYASAAKRGEDASDRLGKSLDRVKTVAAAAGKATAIGVGGAAAALAGAAIDAARFDASMRNVNSIAGLSDAGLGKLEKRVLNLAVAVGKSPTDLADGLYSIVSSGFKANDAMKILTAGARAARAGLTDTATATGAITSVLNAYGLGADHARKVSDLLFQTVNVGVLNFEQLAGSLGKVLPSAKGLGVSLQDLLGAEAALTLQGNSADEATTQLGQVMAGLTKPSVSLAKELHNLGYESGQAAIAHLGFKGTLDALGKAADGNQALLAKWFGNIRAFRGVNGLEGTAHAADVFTSSVKSMDEATKGAGATAAVYAEQQKSTAAQFDHLKAVVDVAAITIGAALLPQINAGITALTKWFIAAQKSGDLQRWAHDISHGVSEIVDEIEHLEPAAQQAFHVVAATVKAALPFVEELFSLFQAGEPEIAAVAKAVTGLVAALGPGPILAGVGAFKALQTAGLGAQVGVGKFAKVMREGSLAIAGAESGGVNEAGKITRIGSEAVTSASKLRIFATGLAKTIGNPNLIAAGAAGIVVSILFIRSTMTSLKNEAQDVVDALAELQGSKIDLASARIAQTRAQGRLDVAQKTAGSRAVDLSRTLGADPRPAALKAAAPTQAEIKATNDFAAAQLNVRDAANQVDRAEAVLAAARGKRAGAQEKLAQQLVGLGQKAVEQTQHHDLTTDQSPGGRFGPDALSAVQRQQKAVDAFVTSLRSQAAADKDLDAAAKGAASRVADTVAALKIIPTKKQFRIIADDVAAGRSLARIKRDLGIIDHTTATATLDGYTKPADDAAHRVKLEMDAAAKARTVHLGTSGFDGVQAAISSINTNILHLTQNPWKINITYATSGTPPTGGSSKVNKKPAAEGRKLTGPEILLAGEDGDEYVIPVSGKHKASGIALWLAAGRDLGIAMAAKGKKPGKTPPPIKRGLGYDPAALDAQQATEKDRLDKARSYRDTLAGRVSTDAGHEKTLQKEIDSAKSAVSKANARPDKTAAQKKSKAAAQQAASKRLASLQAELKKVERRLADERKAHQHQVAEVIPAEVKRYQAATAAAKIGDDHAKQITLWQDRADTATSAMSLASSQWDAADRKKDQPGRDKAYKAWDAARKERISDLGHVKSLLEDVKKVVGKTDYGAQIAKSLTDTLGDIVSAQDDTQAPGYQAPDDTVSTNIADYLNPFEQTELQQVAYAEAVASTTDSTQDDVDAATGAFGVANQIAERLQREGAPIDIVTQAFQAIASAKSDLASAVQANTPTVAGPTPDQQAQLDQATARATAAEASSASDRAALRTFQQSGDLFSGQGVNITIQSLHPDNPEIQRAVTNYVVQGLGTQPYVPTSTGYYGG
jgi:TP901 family phage tail tape measure protein